MFHVQKLVVQADREICSWMKFLLSCSLHTWFNSNFHPDYSPGHGKNQRDEIKGKLLPFQQMIRGLYSSLMFMFHC